jgi:protein-tyrosine-phosphatase
VLFACGQNSVRSPMAAALMRQAFGNAFVVASAGVRKGELDGFAIAAMNEIGIDIASHEPMTFEELEDLEDGLDFDLIETLAPEAHHKALSSRTGSLPPSNTGRRPIRPISRASRAAARRLSGGA